MICEGCGCVFCPDVTETLSLYCSQTCRSTVKARRKRHRRAAEREAVALESAAQEAAAAREAVRLAACARDRKIRYQTKTQARKWAKQIWRRSHWRLYPYKCPCGWWHLTAQKPEMAMCA